MIGKYTWLSENVFFLGLVSLLIDASHEMATAILPFLLTLDLKYPAAALGLIEGLSDGASGFVKPFSGYVSEITCNDSSKACARMANHYSDWKILRV